MIRTVLVATFLSTAVQTDGCTAFDSCRPKPGSGTSINVSLVDAPVAGFQRVDIDVQKVEIHMATQGWITAAAPNRVVNLLELVGGVSDTLASHQTIGAGKYEQMRLILGTRNSVTLADGTVQPLEVPSAFNSGVKLPLSFTVASGTTKDVFIDFDALRSVHVKKAGGSGRYILRPVVKAFDQIVTGSVSGRLTDNGAGIAGAIVTAQTLSSAGEPTVQRMAVTDATGNFTLDLLPVNATYFVVSQPVVGGASYAAVASQGVALSQPSPTATIALSTTLANGTGTLTGSVKPVAGDAEADLAQVIGTIAGQRFVLRSEPPMIDGNDETFAFADLPGASYDVALTRTSFDSEGAVQKTDVVRQSAVLVPIGGLTNVSLSVH